MQPLSTSFISEVLNQQPSGNTASIAIKEVVVDSRRATAATMFVALPGEQRDGHEFIPSAISQGAAVVLCRKTYAGTLPHHVAVYRVDDTQKALETIAFAWRSRFSIPVAAVVGSVGKTTTKELLAAVVQGRYGQVLKTAGSENGEIGLPLTLLKLRDNHEMAVIEVGIDAPGMMEKHLKLVRPNAAICTAIAPEHMHLLLDMATVIQEETLCLKTVAAAGYPVALNLDDEAIAPLASTLPPASWYGFSIEGNGKSGPRGLSGRWDATRGHMKVSGMGFQEMEIMSPLPGAHNARNLLGAMALAASLGLTPQEIVGGLKTFEPPQGRSQVKTLPNGAVFVCDYYNASPASMAAAFASAGDLLQQAGEARGRLWLCLADMLELGADEEAYHRNLAPLISQARPEGVFYMGSRMAWLADSLKRETLAGEVIGFTDHSELAKHLNTRLKAGDVVLIKGSRGMRMERVWQTLAES